MIGRDAQGEHEQAQNEQARNEQAQDKRRGLASGVCLVAGEEVGDGAGVSVGAGAGVGNGSGAGVGAGSGAGSDAGLSVRVREGAGDVWAPRRPMAMEVGRPPFRLTGGGPAMMKLRDEIERAALADFAVLIEGETGAGKEMVARQIHQWSRRRKGPWVAVNCAALVDSLVESELFGIEDRTATGVRGRRGKIELAHTGTLFLDEVAELSPHVQAKLLRVLQDFVVERVGSQESRRVSARLIVATNRSLGPLVRERVFRQDLFYRVNLLTIQVPPLRDRLGDVSELARAFLSEHRDLGITRVSSAALEVLRTYEWPGNVRELFNVLADSSTRAMARGSAEIAIPDLPEVLSRPYREVLQPSIEHGDSMRTWAGRYARLVLERCGNNKRKACQRLDISYHTLQAYLTQAHRGTVVVPGAIPGEAAGKSR